MLVEAIIAFVLIFIVTVGIYAIGRKSAPKTAISENEQSTYACGEIATVQRLRINVSLYKYLVYFLVFDSAVLLLAFASVAIAGVNPFLLIIYLGIILASGIVLLDGGKD